MLLLQNSLLPVWSQTLRLETEMNPQPSINPNRRFSISIRVFFTPTMVFQSSQLRWFALCSPHLNRLFNLAVHRINRNRRFSRSIRVFFTPTMVFQSPQLRWFGLCSPHLNRPFKFGGSSD
ncbi:unnamed protein product [Microthlaspi erraticum]|uniref:Uncharacterized protein n=1 Tax=Microthlaspi erraticum TaxID=1685480 RepID=A0A6D2KD34_9BRAS|nr:unnamed protein product [Microthlaspi erraticum]